jgi:hypothetical protein
MNENTSLDGCIKFMTARHLEILVITQDGRIERGKDFKTDDEASESLIKCIKEILKIVPITTGKETIFVASHGGDDNVRSSDLCLIGGTEE